MIGKVLVLYCKEGCVCVCVCVYHADVCGMCACINICNLHQAHMLIESISTL